MRRSSTEAPRTRKVAAVMPMKSWSTSKLSCSDGLMNGPRPSAVPVMATTEHTNVAEMAPRWPKRRAAHMSSGKKKEACPMMELAGPPDRR